MKKIAVILCALMLMTSTCWAITAEQIALGGVTLGCTSDYVVGIYGRPDSVTHSNNPDHGPTTTYKYGDSLSVTFRNHDGIAVSVVSSGNNGLVTPDGIKVGSSVSDVYAIYGVSQRASNKSIFYIAPNSGKSITFVVSGNNVSEIRLWKF